MPLILHKLDASPPARAAMMVGNILGLDLEYVEPDFMSGQHLEPEYLEKNPMHTVPMLEDDDFVVVDSHAIVTYLVSKYGQAKRTTLYPSDLYERATIDARLHFDTGVLFQRIKAITEPTYRGTSTGITEEMTSKVEEAYQMLEAYLNKTTYIALNHFTVADICCGATVSSLNIFVPIDFDRFPRLIEWYGSLHSESCFPEINSPGNESLLTMINDLWITNQGNAVHVVGL